MWRIRSRSPFQKCEGVKIVFKGFSQTLETHEFFFSFWPSLLRCDVGSQHRDVGGHTPWNVTTLDLNVATSVFPFSRTSQRWISTSRRQFFHSLERRDVGFMASLERCDVECQRRNVGNSTLGNVATLPLFIDQMPYNFYPPLRHPCRNPPDLHCCRLRPPYRLSHYQP